MSRFNVDKIIMIENEVRFGIKKNNDYIDEEIHFLILGNKQVRGNDELTAQEVFYICDNKKTYLFSGPYTSPHIDNESVRYNYMWQELLKDNKHYKKFEAKIDKNNQVSKYDLLELESNYNKDMRKNALKIVDDITSINSKIL